MLKKRAVICTILLCISSMFISHAQLGLLIKDKAGTVISYELTNIRRITFPDQTLKITKTDASENFYSLVNVQMMHFMNITAVPVVTDNQSDMVKLFPNPVSEKLNCLYSTSKDAHVLFQIINVDGRVMVQYPYQAISGINEISFLISTLPDGLYLLRVQNEDAIQSVKFMKK